MTLPTERKPGPGFTPATVVPAEGARIGLMTCDTCGAAVLCDPRDDVNRLDQHLAWHEAHDRKRHVLTGEDWSAG